jgi:WD40 repeat protein
MFFLSYAGIDVASAQALAEGLKAAGADVWVHSGPKALDAGTPYPEQLEQKLKQSSALLLLVGTRGVDRWVRVEVDVALIRQVESPSYRIIPLLLPGVQFRQLPPFIARFHSIPLEGDVTSWERSRFQALAQQLGTVATGLSISPDECPFPGLESFREEHARFYFGRDREIRRAAALLGRGEGAYRRWLAVYGASGTGKSSFVRAGLVPAIRTGWVEGAPARWRVAVMRPGKDPVHQLARALVQAFDWQQHPGKLPQVEEALRHPTGLGLRDFVSQMRADGEGFLLVVDQLEETFTLSEGAQEEPRLLDVLLDKALSTDQPFHLITTIRSDFMGRINELPHLARALNDPATSHYFLGPMEVANLREAILGPAQLAGLTWDEGLPDRILQDAPIASGGLPLVSHALRELWTRRSKQVLTHTAYAELGGVGGALTRSADELLNTFTPEERAHVRRLMLALVKVGRGARDVRRALTLEEAVTAAGGGSTGHGILVRLSGGRAPHSPADLPAPPRLLTVTQERVDLVHEALLEQWQRLRAWLEESRKELERQDDLEAAARLWKATGALPSEAQLKYLKAAQPVSAPARELLERIRDADLARGLVEQATEIPIRDDPQLSLRLIIEAHQLEPSEQTAAALLSWYLRRQRLHLLGHKGPLWSACFSPDGKHLLTASKDQTARVWAATTGLLLMELRGHEDTVHQATFSPDGQRVLTASQDKTAWIWDVRSGKPLVKLRGHKGPVRAALFSPDGQHVLTASEDMLARYWDAQSGKLLFKLRGHEEPVVSAAFSADGQRILTASMNGTALLWDIPNKELLATLRGHTRTVWTVAFSPNGQSALTASEDGKAHLWDAQSGQHLAELRGHSGPLHDASFSADGQRVLTASQDGTARLWNAKSGRPLIKLRGHAGPVMAATFSPRGQRVLTASQDGTARLWDTKTGKPLATLRGHTEPVVSAAFSLGGHQALTASEDMTARLWDTQSGQPTADLTGHSLPVTATFSPDSKLVLTTTQGGVTRLWSSKNGKALAKLSGSPGTVRAAAFSPDGQQFLIACETGTVQLWDTKSRKRVAEFHEPLGDLFHKPSGTLVAAAFGPTGPRALIASPSGAVRSWNILERQAWVELRMHTQPVVAATFSPDGQRVLTVSNDFVAWLWDATTGQPLTELRGNSSRITASFSQDGARLLTASEDKIARCWDTQTGQVLVEFRGHSGPLWDAAFSPDGHRVVTASEDATARLWDARTGQPLAELRGHSSSVNTVAFSPSGQRILTASKDGTARLWDAVRRQPLADLRGHSSSIWSASFSRSGERVLTASLDGTVRLWWVHELCAPTEELFRLARRSSVRELTPEERQRYLPRGSQSG